MHHETLCSFLLLSLSIRHDSTKRMANSTLLFFLFLWTVNIFSLKCWHFISAKQWKNDHFNSATNDDCQDVLIYQRLDWSLQQQIRKDVERDTQQRDFEQTGSFHRTENEMKNRSNFSIVVEFVRRENRLSARSIEMTINSHSSLTRSLSLQEENFFRCVILDNERLTQPNKNKTIERDCLCMTLRIDICLPIVFPRIAWSLFEKTIDELFMTFRGFLSKNIRNASGQKWLMVEWSI